MSTEFVPVPSAASRSGSPGALDTPDRLKRLILFLTAALLTLLLAAALGAGVWFWQSRYGSLFASNYALDVSFDDAKGVEVGDAVHMAGVRIGTVEKVGVSGGVADVHLRIRNDAAIPQNSRFVARPDFFSMPGGIDVVVGISSEAIAPGQQGLIGKSGQDVTDAFQKINTLTDRFSRVGARSETLLTEATRTARDARTTLNDPQMRRDLRETLAGAKAVTNNGAQITQRTAQLLDAASPRAQEAAVSAARMTKAAADMTVEMRAFARASKPQAVTLLSDARRTTAAAARATERGAALLPPPSPANAARTTKMLDDMAAITTNLRTTATRVDAITANGQTALADPAAAADLRETIRSLKAVSEAAERAAKNADPLLSDPTLPADVRDTVRQVHEISVTTRSLLDTLSGLVQKAQTGGGGPLGKLLGGGGGSKGGKEDSKNSGKGNQNSPPQTSPQNPE